MTDRPTSPWPLPLPPGEEPPMLPLSVWPTGQRDPLAQLRDAGCAPGTETDTDRIPPAVAAHAIATYTRPGDLVLDPDCGAGTVLCEALRASRHTLGLTARTQWWTLARANITAAKTAGAWRDGSVLDARPKVLATVRVAGLIGRVGLVLTTPLIAAATAAGLAPVERCIALTAGLRGNRLVTRASLTERRAAAQARTAGTPTALTAHHEVLVFQLAHETELAAAGIPRPTEDEVSRPAVNGAVDGVEYPSWRRAA